jgi:integrating conjugative element protein (TIGR03749 family)
MFDCRKTLSCLWLVLAAGVANAEDAQHIVWNKTPITLRLSVEGERRIEFRAPVRVGVPALLNNVLRTQTVNSTVYFQARRSFPKTRVLVRELDSGQVYLFDITADEAEQENAPVIVHRSESAHLEKDAVGSSRTPIYVTLTRFAAQQLYAPERLLSAVSGMRRVPVQSPSSALLPGRSVEATPLIAWRTGDYYVTAVRLRNTGKRSVTLDPRKLRGNWLSASFQHARLLRSGGDADTTALYLVSAQPFAESL